MVVWPLTQAPYGNWNSGNGQVNVNWNDVGNQNDNMGVRLPEWGSLSYVVDFSQPPSIRPISSIWACNCMIRVSFTSDSSRYRRSLNRNSSSSD